VTIREIRWNDRLPHVASRCRVRTVAGRDHARMKRVNIGMVEDNAFDHAWRRFRTTRVGIRQTSIRR
jgi:hypothetical protein